MGQLLSASEKLDAVILDIILALVGLAAVLVVLVIVINSAADLRDWFVNQGWVKETSFLARMTRRAQTARFKVFLDLLGLDEHQLAPYRSLGDPITKRGARLGPELTSRPDIGFLRRIKSWIYVLDDPYTYRGSSYYLDIMGAVHWRKDHEASLEQVFLAWLRILLDRQVLPPFDCILAVKEGNPLLARAVAEVARKRLIICKGEHERSRVERPAGDVSHESDFEGLHAFLSNDGLEGDAAIYPRRAVIIDDSCSGGSQISSAARRFNEYVTERNLPFHPVKDVVILFRVKDADGIVDNAALTAQGLEVHSLLALGPEELRELHDATIDDAIRDIERFKREELSCATSHRLLRDATPLQGTGWIGPAPEEGVAGPGHTATAPQHGEIPASPEQRADTSGHNS